MEMERINENTIRVLVDNDDLSARGTALKFNCYSLSVNF